MEDRIARGLEDELFSYTEEEGYLDWEAENVEFHEVSDSDDESSDEDTVSGDGDGELAYEGDFVEEERRGLVEMPFYDVELEEEER